MLEECALSHLIEMQDVLNRVATYREHALYLGGGHYQAGKWAARRHIMLGVPVVVATAIVSTSIFATLNEQPSVQWKIAAGLISLVAVVLAALQTFFKYSELAEKHKTAGANYGSLRRRIELFQLRYAGDPRQRLQALGELDEIAEQFGELAEVSPDLPDRFYDFARASLGREVNRDGSNHIAGARTERDPKLSARRSRRSKG